MKIRRFYRFVKNPEIAQFCSVMGFQVFPFAKTVINIIPDNDFEIIRINGYKVRATVVQLDKLGIISSSTKDLKVLW